MPIPTPFHDRTAPLCTSYRWKDWGGYHTVCRFGTEIDPEYYAIRHAAGLMDVTPLFKYAVSGPDAGSFLAWVMARDIGRLKPGRVVYCCFCDDDGKLVDDGTVACLSPNRYRVTAAGPALRWFQINARGFDVEIRDTTDDIGALAVQGPNARDVLSAAIDEDLGDLRYFGQRTAKIAGKSIDITRTGYTGDLGYEIWVPRDDAGPVWDAIIAAGKAYGLMPQGLDALDLARVEAGFIMEGVDYFSAPHCAIESRKSTPYEAGLGWTVKLDRDPFIGQAALRAEKARGPTWAFVGLDIDWDTLEALYDRFGLPPGLPCGAWRGGVPIYERQRQVGFATSGAWSPMLKKNLALATVRAEFAADGTKLQIEHTVEYERHTLPAVVVPRPFFNPERKRK